MGFPELVESLLISFNLRNLCVWCEATIYQQCQIVSMWTEVKLADICMMRIISYFG